jgi:hypothetical protein
MQSIMNEAEGRKISLSEAVRQIGIPTMMSVGWQPKTVISGGDWFRVKVSRRYWLVIKLNAEDLYDVEVGRIRKKDGLQEYSPIEQEHNVSAGDLAKVVLRLGDRA